MAHRIILTARQRAALFDLPTDETSMLRHYILADEDLEIIRTRRRARNRFGFALQLCALRYPGRLRLQTPTTISSSRACRGGISRVTPSTGRSPW